MRWFNRIFIPELELSDSLSHTCVTNALGWIGLVLVGFQLEDERRWCICCPPRLSGA